jgi:hypothetical protein
MNRRNFLQSIIVGGVAPAFIGSSVLMPLRKVWSDDFYYTNDVHFSPEQMEVLLRYSPMRVEQVPPDKFGGAWTNPEIYVRGEWRSLGRTDLIDNVGTGWCTTKSAEEWRGHYLGKVVDAISHNGKHEPYFEKHYYGAGRLQKYGGLSVIDATTDG